MLKIKDEIDLKELERFGFVFVDWYDDGRIVFYEYDLNDDATYIVVVANKSDSDYREIGFSCGLYGDAPNYAIENFDILFDLFQAGFVEKVTS